MLRSDYNSGLVTRGMCRVCRRHHPVSHGLSCVVSGNENNLNPGACIRLRDATGWAPVQDALPRAVDAFKFCIILFI